jgi:hypothetical protein
MRPEERKELHLLYNNAGVMGTPKGTLLKDGYEYVRPNALLFPLSTAPYRSL